MKLENLKIKTSLHNRAFIQAIPGRMKTITTHFKKARRLNNKTSWKVENGHYNLLNFNHKVFL